MTKDEQQRNSERSNSKAAHHCLALTHRVLSDLQVCLSSVELLEGMNLPAEAHQALARLSRAVDALAAAAAEARRPAGSAKESLSVG
jgi:hypothetical protein